MSNWERLESIILHYGMNVNSFAKQIGLKRAERLYQIKRGNYSISKNLTALITQNFPDINEGWLLTGEGDMLKHTNSNHKKIPLYNVGIDELQTDFEDLPIVEELDIPILENSDFAIINNGEAMAPEIAHRSLVFVKRVDLDALVFGDIYLILSQKFNVIRVVREFDKENLRLLPKNTKDFDEIILNKNLIKQVFKVKGVLSMVSI